MNGFDPVLAQSWVLGSSPSSNLFEPPAAFEGWDRDLPFSLNVFNGLNNNANKASINLVPGLYDGIRESEYLFDSFTLDVYYSDEADILYPSLVSQVSYTDTSQTYLVVEAMDNVAVSEVVAVCDDGLGNWATSNLTNIDGIWYGSCNMVTSRFFAQILDSAGNVTLTNWDKPLAAPLPPSAPSLVGPINGTTINDTTPTFEWQNQGNTLNYRIQVDTTPDFTSPEIDAFSTTFTYTTPIALNDDTYYWRVSSQGDIGNWGQWSAVWQIVIIEEKIIYLPVVIRNQ